MNISPTARLPDIEAVLTSAGIPFRRWFDGNDGWFFEVRGEVVPRGGAIWLLGREVRRWLKNTDVLL